MVSSSSSSRLARRRPIAAPQNRISPSLFAPSVVVPEPLAEARIVYKVADNQHERAGAFRLVYENYVESGLMRPNRFQMRVMPHHLLPTTATFVALHAGRVISTLSLVGDGRLGLPLDRVYGPEVEALREPSTWLGEVSALASSSADSRLGFEAVLGLMRMMAQFSRRHGLDHLLVAVHPRHARLYRRAMGFRPLGEERAYPAVCNRPAVALHLDLTRLEQAPAENVALFFGEPIAEEHLRFCPISAAERRYFAPVVAYEADQAAAEPREELLACA
ncbi:MAG TPA: hypothetical protein VNH11_33055 [Pirellulales bacterium]|nr:hypothetical protein [Pirellulales bacterium]